MFALFQSSVLSKLLCAKFSCSLDGFAHVTKSYREEMQWMRYLGYVVLLTVGGAARRIPDNIMIGTSVSSYQVEGAYNVAGRRLFVKCRFAYYKSIFR